MSWRESLLSRIGASGFSGIPLGLWLKVLIDNHFDIDPPYWGRAAAITLSSLQNSVFAVVENAVYGQRIRNARIHPPLFILGIWRSGTTHLHNLFARDHRFAFPNSYQVFYPRTFLTTEKVNAKLVGLFFPKTRPQDNMAMGIQEPQEDEFAFCALTGKSVMMAWAFPRKADRYERYLTFREASAHEVAEWQSALAWFVQKLSFKYGRPLLLKSPGHTCRIRMILDVFPDAKFVHIHRNPYDVFPSTQHTIRKVTPWWTLQRPNYADLTERTIRQYKEVYEFFFAERGLIPKGHLHEVGFEQLEADPIGQMRCIYEALALPDFETVEPALERYVASLSGYKKNIFGELSPDLRDRIAREWRQSFEEWGYVR